MTVDDIDMRRYARQLSLDGFGVAGQLKLMNATVTVVGAGGLGSPALLYLAGAGVGKIVIVDNDIVDLSNLHRQVIHTQHTVGMNKAESARATIATLNAEVNVLSVASRLNKDNALEILSGSDVIIDGTDNFTSRYIIDAAAAALKIPVVWGALLRFHGQLSVFDATKGYRYRTLFPEPPEPEDSPSCAETGVLGVVPGIIGTALASEAIKLITGIGEPLIGRLSLYDALSATWRTLTFGAESTDHPSEETNNVSHELEIPSVTVNELISLLESSDKTTVIDVRNEWERAGGFIKESISIPLGTLTVDEVVNTATHSSTIVFYCASGIRSETAVRLVTGSQQLNGKHVTHLTGGIRAWTDTTVN